MRRKELIDTIAHAASLFVTNIKAQSAMDTYDINIHSEQALIPLLNAVFNLKLINANKIQRNYPAVDLIDDECGVAFQITSSSKSLKVTQTLDAFISNEFHLKYNTLYFFILTEKDETNSNKSKIDKIVREKYQINTDVHIIDYKDILRYVKYIESLDVLKTIAENYRELTTLSEDDANAYKGQFIIGKYLSFSEKIKNDLSEVIGIANLEKVPELSALFERLSELEDLFVKKEGELRECKQVMDKYSADETLKLTLLKACNVIENECNTIKKRIDEQRTHVNDIAVSIKRQKTFLDKIEHSQLSERMQIVKKLFDNGEYDVVNTILNYDGRQQDINEKLQEKEKQAIELKSLSDEEVFIAYSIWGKPDWVENVALIKHHFNQSILLAGYGWNTFQYAYFLEEIDEVDNAIDCLYKTLHQIQEEDLINKGNILSWLGRLLKNSNTSEALDVFRDAYSVYYKLYEENNENEYVLNALAEISYECGNLYYAGKNLEEATSYLENAMLLLSNREKRGSDFTTRLSYLVIMSLGSLHSQLGNQDNVMAYQQLLLQLGAFNTLRDPYNDYIYLKEAIDRFRMLIGEVGEAKEPMTELIYKCALKGFLTLEKWQSYDDIVNNAVALDKLGIKLFSDHETIGAKICLEAALRLFRYLDKKDGSYKEMIASTLSSLALIYMVKNNVSEGKRLLLAALSIYRSLVSVNPVKYLSRIASTLNDLYVNSFIGVPSSKYYKAQRYFDEALEINKQLNDNYKKPQYGIWLQLMEHKAIFISKELDDSSVNEWLEEFVNVIDRIPSPESEFCQIIDRTWHEATGFLIGNIQSDHPLFMRMLNGLLEAGKRNFNKDPDAFRISYLITNWYAGSKLVEMKKYDLAIQYLEVTIELMNEVNLLKPGKYDKEIIPLIFEAACSYSELKRYRDAAQKFRSMFHYLELKSVEYPEFLTLLSSVAYSVATSFLDDGQLEETLSYIVKGKKYLKELIDKAEKKRLERSFAELMRKVKYRA